MVSHQEHGQRSIEITDAKLIETKRILMYQSWCPQPPCRRHYALRADEVVIYLDCRTTSQVKNLRAEKMIKEAMKASSTKNAKMTYHVDKH